MEKKKKKKEKTAGFLFVKPTGYFTPGDMLSRHTKKPKNQHKFLCLGTLSFCM
jgi:hypothetical protein